jgi:hypothetical protein
MAIDPNGDFIITHSTLQFCLHGDNSNIICNGYIWNMGKSNGQSVTVNKSSSIMTFPIPFSDSSSVLGYDVSGVKRDFVYNGIVTAQDMDCITRFIQVMDSLINGQQLESNTTLTYKFNRNWLGLSWGASTNPINIMITNFSYTYNAGQECQLQYSVQISECDPNADGTIGNQKYPWM